MQAEQINASIAGTSTGAYLIGRTVKEWLHRKNEDRIYFHNWFTTDGNLILDDEMYFVNEHGIWLVE